MTPRVSAHTHRIRQAETEREGAGDGQPRHDNEYRAGELARQDAEVFVDAYWRMSMRRLALLAAAALVAVSIAACGEETPSTFAPPDNGSDPSGAEHIHGLGVNPADGSLMIATHSGLFRAAPASDSAVRVGDRRQDTMGFTVVGPDRFLGSGHPDLRDDLPPLLGLIRSEDAGRSWKPVSLLGQADFHVLRTAETRIYGVNASDGQLLVSDDGGRRWASRTPPAPLFDLVATGDDPDRVIATGEQGLFITRDSVASWRPLNEQLTGLLTSVRGDGLYLVDGRGVVHRSRDGGRTWKTAGDTGGQPAAFASHDAELFVALHTNEVKASIDGGRTWRTRVTP